LTLTAIALVEYPPDSGKWIDSGEERTISSRIIRVLAREKQMVEVISSFFEENWKYLLSTFIIPVALWYKKRKDKKNAKPPGIQD